MGKRHDGCALTAKRIERLIAPGRYRDGGQRGLYLQVRSATNRSWLLRFVIDGRERWMGLGPLELIGLADARRRAHEARVKLLDGLDPIEARLAEQDEKRKDEAARISFKEAAEQFLELHEDGWRNAKHRQQWRNTLRTYAYPKLGSRPIKMIDAALINDALAHIWTTKPETASRVRLRIERVLQWVAAGKPLPTRGKAKRTKNHPALPYAEIPAFIADLRERDSISARALELLILTAGRTSEITQAVWSEFDLDAKVWTIPAERMKGGREHRVPLSVRAVAILESLPQEEGNPYVLIGARKGKPLSNMAMLELLRGMRPGFTVHGFRSTFRDWCAEATNTPNHIAEMALAHTVGGVEGAYRRGDLFAKRARLMMDWATYCQKSATSDTVVLLKHAAAG